MRKSGLAVALAILLSLPAFACRVTTQLVAAPSSTNAPLARQVAMSTSVPLLDASPPAPMAVPTLVATPSVSPPGRLAPDAQSVREENAQPGTSAWRIANYAAAGEIQAYAGAVSVESGDAIDLYVSTRAPGSLFRIDVFRMGWYAGLGARLMTSVLDLRGQAQGFYTGAGGLVGCTRCRVDPSTGLLDANWLPSYHLPVPKEWLSGVYLALLTDASGKQTYVPFVVRQDERASALLLQASFNTYEAYNAWGGKSLYDANSSGAVTLRGARGAVKVSFNRPFDADFGSGQFLRYEYNLVRWVEQQGYDVSYATNSDVDAEPSLLLNHSAFISAGHDEYWSGAERQHVQEALTQGTNLAFLSGDAVYWQVRYEKSDAGVPNRTLVCYRGSSDPAWQTEPAQATVRWQDPPVEEPENALTGTIYGGQLNPFVQDWVVQSTDNWIFDGTGLRPGDHVAGLVGKEYDHSVPSSAAPAGLQVLARSPVVNRPDPATGWAESTLYTAPSGATVFSAGTVSWSWGLDASAFPLGALHATPVSPAIQRLTANLLDRFQGVTRHP